jgi:MYXO-CTERM domain-containing protein
MGCDHPARNDGASPGGYSAAAKMSDSLRRPLPAALSLFVLAASLSASTDTRAQVGSTAAPLIQGTASLVEAYDPVAPPAIAAVVIETQAALMLTSALTLTETTAALNATPTLSELWQLCPGEPFEEQPTAAFCSGTLIAPDLLLTAEHCVPNERSCDALSVVFDYRYTSASVLAPLERDDVYACDRILASDGDGDYALIRLDRPVVGRTPAQPRFTDPKSCLGVAPEERVWAAGFPSGVPLKLDLGDVEADLPVGVWVDDASVTSRKFFRGRFDLFAGMDGGGVFNYELDAADAGVVGTVELVGFLSAGRADYTRADDGCFTNVRVSDDGSELAGHVIQPLVALCNRRSDYPTLCPATVSRCSPGDAGVGADAGMRAFPPSTGCGCRVPGTSAATHGEDGRGLLLTLGALMLVLLRARRRYSRTSPRAKMLAT